MDATPPPHRSAALDRFLLRSFCCIGALFLAACSTGAANLIATPTATSGDVTLTPDRTSYGAHQAIGVTVTNNGKAGYYAKDGLSACTYLQLEFYDTSRKAWVAVDGCSSPNPPQVRLLAPSTSLPFTLAPGDASNDPNAWVPGIYRVSLRFGTAVDGSGTLVVAYSSGFQITS
jgi:hypothetical protein